MQAKALSSSPFNQSLLTKRQETTCVSSANAICRNRILFRQLENRPDLRTTSPQKRATAQSLGPEPPGYRYSSHCLKRFLTIYSSHSSYWSYLAPVYLRANFTQGSAISSKNREAALRAGV